MALLVTGAGGQLGRALLERAPDAVGRTRAELDVTDAAALEALDWSGIDGIVNAAAWTQVDRAEDDGAVLDAWHANATAVANLAVQARRRDLPLVHVSSDYVFGGRVFGGSASPGAAAPLPVDAPLDPLGAYGLTKAGGELAARLAPRHHVVRTSWVFGEGANFVRTMLRLAETRESVTVVDDQRGRPTYAGDLADGLLALLSGPAPYGTHHVTNRGPVVSWAEFAEEVFAAAGVRCRVERVSTEEYLRGRSGVAPRPAYSALDTSAAEAVGVVLPDWRESLRSYVAGLVPAAGGAR